MNFLKYENKINIKSAKSSKLQNSFSETNKSNDVLKTEINVQSSDTHWTFTPNHRKTQNLQKEPQGVSESTLKFTENFSDQRKFRNYLVKSHSSIAPTTKNIIYI